MRTPFAGLALAALLAASTAPARAEETRITLLHTTDLHAALAAWDYGADRPAARGLAKLATMVKAVRAEWRPMLLLDDGDALTGGAIETAWENAPPRSHPVIEAMNRMGYDAMAVGNHEFDLGGAGLERVRRQARFPFLAANVRGARGDSAFAPSLVREIGGARIGVVGLTTPAVPAMLDSALWAGLVFGSPVEAARAEVARLRAAGCDAVVLLAHTGLERDPATGAPRAGDTPDENWGWRLASEVPGVDLVILGHTHAVIPFARVGGVLVTQAGKSGEQLGRVDLTLTRDAAGTPWKVSARASLLAVADSVAPDPEIEAFVLPLHDRAQVLLDEPLGTARAPFEARGRLENSAPWELVHRVQLAASGADVSLAALFDPGARIGAGRVTRRDVLRLYPYDNPLVTVELTGAELKQVLEHAAAYFTTYSFEPDRPLAEPGRPGFNFDAASGVTYEIDLTRPVGQRIVTLLFEGEPLDPARRLKVAVNGYRASGGGGYPALAGAPRVARATKPVRALIEDWIRREREIAPVVRTNWRLLPDYATRPERPLVDLLIRRGVVPRDEALRLGPSATARKGDLAYWLARAFDWRERKRSNAFPDAPDSLEPWLDGLLKRKVLGSQAELDWIRPHNVVSLGLALDWCTRAAKAARYTVGEPEERAAFRRSLLTGFDPERLAASVLRDSLTRIEVLALVANTRFPTIRVLETTDFHGAILPGASERRSGRAVGGSAVLAAWIERLRDENPEGTVLLDGGDCFQGTMISNLQFGRPVVEQMNALGYDAMAIGNHEFDWTADTLRRRVEGFEFAALGANMIERRTKKRPKWVRSDTSFVRRGVDVGVVGLCYRNTPSVTLAAYVAHLRFEDDSAAAARVVPRLRKEGSDVVLAVGHVPAETDSLRHARSGDLVRLARGVRGVDAWFGGHSHNQVLDEVNGVPVLISGAQGQLVGVCDLVVDPVAGRVVEHRARLQPTYADEVVPDSAMAARVARWNSGVARVAATVIGTNARALTRNRNAESGVGNFVADAMRGASGADLALQNSGGLRADLAAGPITKGAIYEVMPFDNTVVTMELTGAEVRRVFEEGLRYGRVAQLSGVNIAFDPSRPEMQRVVTLTLANGTPLEDARTYKVAVNNFMATGGDNYDTLARGRNVVDTGIVIRTTLEQYVAERTKRGEPLEVKLDGRIRRLGDAPRDER